jgi:ABC-type lipoprotein export system ATPase subunit/GNAT superfamily N-acetyltransferase
MRRREEFFRVTKYARTYDKLTGKFKVNIAYQTATEITPRTIGVAEGFGLGIDESQQFVIYDDVVLKIGDRDVVYITGDSGSGKSVLLKAMKQDLGDEAIDVADVQPDPDKPLIETVGKTLTEGLELLSKAGLNDAFLFVRRFKELSDGQKYRYKIAKLIESRKQWWIADEFCATLDRDSARIVSFNIQKLARNLGKAVIVATTHTDLFDDLDPSVHIHKRYGKEITVNYHPNQTAKECSLVKEMWIEEGTTKDWRELACFHYRSHRICAPRKIFCLKRGTELCGVIVYGYPPPTCFGRRLVLPKMGMKELNEKLSIISRVVVHPKYRTIGLGSKLVRDTLPLAGTENVEMPAVMAKYNPFAEKAGMRKVIEQPPSEEAYKIVETLEHLGFNTQLLNSTNYVLNKLSVLNDEDITRIREAFVKYSHTRFLKSFSLRLPFGVKEAYKERILNAKLDKLADLIKICSFLMQTKAYLFWSRTCLSKKTANDI